MKDLEILEARQTRIYASDQLNFGRLTPVRAQRFKDVFGWNSFKPDADNLQFLNGSVPGTETPIKSFVLNQQRALIGVVGDSQAAAAAYRAVAEFFAKELDSKGWHSEPLVLVHETLAVATLDFAWSELFSDSYIRFAEAAVRNQLSEGQSKAEISGLNLSLKIRYRDPSPELADYGIAFSAKALTVEPRINRPLADRRYFTVSPTDTDTHTQLLVQLEQSLAGARRREPHPAAAPRSVRKRRS